MAETFIDYDAKVQDALRGVVKTILSETAENGLVGDHHFYIAFKTQAEGVDIPDHLKTRFPEEMTIVLQHKFWGLKVSEEQFEVGLSFNQQPAQLVIPFDAVVGFVDPSVQFALQFHEETDLEEEEEPATGSPSTPDTIVTADDETPDADQAPSDGTDNVVTLDAFRKK